MASDNKIISMSLKPQDLDRIAAIQEKTGITSRSEVIRKALAEFEQRLETNGTEGVISVVHDDSHKQQIHELQHTFSDIIVTQFHQCLTDGCLEVYIISGESGACGSFQKALRGTSGVHLVSPVWLNQSSS